VETINFQIKTSLLNTETGEYSSYYLYPRSSISNTPLIMANSVGIIDSGYRGNLMAKVKYMPSPEYGQQYHIIKGTRLFQICAPNLQNIKVNMTLCFSLNQALLAAKAGAAYVSPFVGRLEDIGKDGVGLIADIRSAYNNYGIKTEILAASIRTLKHIEQVALCGTDVITVPAKVLSEMVSHHLTDVGLKKFNEDWAKSGKQI
jgi:hypothetical protein